MLQRAIDAGVPFAWVTADEAYGQVKHTRFWLEQRKIAHVMATKVNDTVVTTGWAEARVDKLIAALPRQRWKRLSGGAGAHGERVYDWARVAIRPCWEDSFGHWVLARRSVSDPTEIAYYVCYGPAASRLKDLLRVAAARWAVEECFQTAKGECGLDHYQVRLYRAWYRPQRPGNPPVDRAHRHHVPPPCQRTPSALVTLPQTQPGPSPPLALQTSRPQPPDAVAVLVRAPAVGRQLLRSADDQTWPSSVTSSTRSILLVAP